MRATLWRIIYAVTKEYMLNLHDIPADYPPPLKPIINLLLHEDMEGLQVRNIYKKSPPVPLIRKVLKKSRLLLLWILVLQTIVEREAVPGPFSILKERRENPLMEKSHAHNTPVLKKYPLSPLSLGK